MFKGKRKWGILLILAIVILALLGTVAASKAQDYLETLDVYWRVHNEVLLPTEIGRHYIDLYFYYSDELFRLSLASPTLQDESLALIFMFEPWLKALVEGQGDDVIVTMEMVTRVQTYLDHIYEKARPELRQTLYEERARFPLENLVGLSMEEARRQLVGLPENPTPVPTSFPPSAE
ncbi:MAG: hypothetical protein MUO58_03265 [Anaerolineales bacterium]|nr:hypothetical protein [Anaerolineales bacterium]